MAARNKPQIDSQRRRRDSRRASHSIVQKPHFIVQKRHLSEGSDPSLDRKAWWRRLRFSERDGIAQIDRMITMALLAGMALIVWAVILWCAWKIIPRLMGYH